MSHTHPTNTMILHLQLTTAERSLLRQVTKINAKVSSPSYLSAILWKGHFYYAVNLCSHAECCQPPSFGKATSLMRSICVRMQKERYTNRVLPYTAGRSAFSLTCLKHSTTRCDLHALCVHIYIPVTNIRINRIGITQHSSIKFTTFFNVQQCSTHYTYNS